MKKIFVILIAMVGFAISANADGETCAVPGTANSISITKVERVHQSATTQHSDGPHIVVTVNNPSNKWVSFSIAPKKDGSSNVSGTQYGQLGAKGGTSGSTSATITFKADDRKLDMKIGEFDLKVTSCGVE
jgi:hypothetical protein